MEVQWICGPRIEKALSIRLSSMLGYIFFLKIAQNLKDGESAGTSLQGFPNLKTLHMQNGTSFFCQEACAREALYAAAFYYPPG